MRYPIDEKDEVAMSRANDANPISLVKFVKVDGTVVFVDGSTIFEDRIT